MALTAGQIDTFYVNALGRHATSAEQAAFVALSATESTAQVQLDIATLPEALSIADPIVRLYQGAFNRVPDVAGFNGWENFLRSGHTLLQAAQSFVGSAEFTALYGSTAVTPALITAYYHNILGRDPSAAEVNAWATSGLSAAQILVGFTESAEFVAKTQTSVNNFIVTVEGGGHPTGPLPAPAPVPAVTITSDHDAGGVNEGSVVTFTVVGGNGAADAGKVFAYNLSGSAADLADISGVPLSGNITLDATGVAKLAVSVTADHLTEGPETLTLNVAGQGDTVTVNDTSLTPVQQFFTSTVGETLTGANGQDTTFVGLVDRGIIDQSTLSNIVDIANGGTGAHNTEWITVLHNGGTEIEPTAHNVQEIAVTDRNGSTFDLRFVPQIQTIQELNSDHSSVFNNVPNLVNLDLNNPDAGGVGITVNVANTVASGAVQVSLENAGPNGADVNIRYMHQNGSDVVSEFDFVVTGQNQDVDLFNTSLTNTITVGGNDSTSFLGLDLDQVPNGLNALTLIDASVDAGALTMNNIGEHPGSRLQNNLTVLGAQGNNVFTIDANGHAVNVTTQGGTDVVSIDHQGVGAVTVTTNDGNHDTVTVNNNGNSDTGAVTVNEGNGAGDSVVITTGNNISTDPAAPVNVHVGTGTGDFVRVNDGNWHAVNITALGDAAQIIVDPANNAPVTINANGGDANISVDVSFNSPVTVNATGGGTQHIHVGVGANSAINITTGGGADFVDVAGTTGNTANVALGGGNDRLQIDDLAVGALAAGMSFDGGPGTDTFAISSAVAHGGLNGSIVTGFENLELTTTMANTDIVASDFVTGNKVILDAGFSGFSDLEGINSGVTVDITGSGNLGFLNLDVTGSNVHNNDIVNIALHGHNVGTNFATIGVEDIESVHITSSNDGLLSSVNAVNTVALFNVGQHTTTLNLDGTNELDLSASGLAPASLNFVTAINASTMTGALHFNDGGDNQNVVVNLGHGADQLTLGNGNNQINLGDGGDTLHLGSGSNTVIGGAGNDSITFAAHGALTDTLVYNAANQSAFGSGDAINGFNNGTDKIDISAFSQNPFSFDGNVGTFANVLADIAGDAAGRTTAVYDTGNHTLYVDVNGDHVLDAAHDMQINFTGVVPPTLATANFIV